MNNKIPNEDSRKEDDGTLRSRVTSSTTPATATIREEEDDEEREEKVGKCQNDSNLSVAINSDSISDRRRSKKKRMTIKRGNSKELLGKEIAISKLDEMRKIPAVVNVAGAVGSARLKSRSIDDYSSLSSTHHRQLEIKMEEEKLEESAEEPHLITSSASMDKKQIAEASVLSIVTPRSRKPQAAAAKNKTQLATTVTVTEQRSGANPKLASGGLTLTADLETGDVTPLGPPLVPGAYAVTAVDRTESDPDLAVEQESPSNRTRRPRRFSRISSSIFNAQPIVATLVTSSFRSSPPQFTVYDHEPSEAGDSSGEKTRPLRTVLQDPRIRVIIGFLILFNIITIAALIGVIMMGASNQGNGNKSPVGDSPGNNRMPLANVTSIVPTFIVPTPAPTTSVSVPVLSETDIDDNHTTSPSGAPTNMPTLAPSLSPVIPTIAPTQLASHLLDILSENSPDGGIALRKLITSPQYRAARSLLAEASNGLVTSRSQELLLQRYALLILYYVARVSSRGSTLWSGLRTTTHECLWRNVVCNKSDFVVEIKVDGTGLGGTLPNEFALLPHLTSLSLNGNQFRGTIPTSFQHLIKLEQLFLEGNELSGSFPSVLLGLPRLTHLRLIGNTMITGSLPSDISRMSSLEKLELSFCGLEGEIPSSMWGMPTLTHLYLGRNKFIGTLSSSISAMFALRELDLEDNKLQGQLPDTLGDLTALSKLQLGGNEFSGSIPAAALRKMKNLDSIDLRENNLNGTIPADLGLITWLGGSVWLQGNKLNGTIPSELGRLRRLGFDLNLSRNKLRGTIPLELGWLSNLEHTFTLADNELSGTIPPTFVQMSNIAILLLNNNPGISGTIPDGLGALTSMKTFAAYNTNLTGFVPPDLCDLTQERSDETTNGKSAPTLDRIEVDCDLICNCCGNFCF